MRDLGWAGGKRTEVIGLGLDENLGGRGESQKEKGQWKISEGWWESDGG